MQLNLSAVRNHYEVQIAAMGIRGVPNEQQAIAGVQKKGTAGLKFKSKPAIAAHAYAEVCTCHVHCLVDRLCFGPGKPFSYALYRDQLHPCSSKLF
jgi:hypothetical protein